MINATGDNVAIAKSIEVNRLLLGDTASAKKPCIAIIHTLNTNHDVISKKAKAQILYNPIKLKSGDKIANDITDNVIM